MARALQLEGSSASLSVILCFCQPAVGVCRSLFDEVLDCEFVAIIILPQTVRAVLRHSV